MQELAERIGRASQCAHYHIKQLIRKGYLRQEEGKSRGLTLARSLSQETSGVTKVRILGTVAAGSPIFAEENHEGEVLIDQRLTRGGQCFAQKVSGNSMTNAGIRNGDLVIVRQQPMAENGDIVVALVDGDATVKRLSICEDTVELCPENDRYHLIPITMDTDFRILGKVVAHHRM